MEYGHFSRYPRKEMAGRAERVAPQWNSDRERRKQSHGTNDGMNNRSINEALESAYQRAIASDKISIVESLLSSMDKIRKSI